MPELKTYRIFISHAWTYSDEYDRLVDMLNKAPYFYWQNYSVPAYDPLHTKTKRELEQSLYNQIRPTNIVIVLAGMYVPYREWIEKEIDIATEMKKPIIGVVPWGGERIPLRVQNAVNEMVRWNTSSIVDAIRKWAI